MRVETGICVPREPAVDLVRMISEGTYTSFPQALKEFVSNAYDADATRVDLSLDDECSSLTIRDNGIGMTYDEFRDYFASIGRRGAAAETRAGRTALGRPRVGRFGIGSLAVIGAADSFHVRSTKKLSGEGFQASIDLRHLRTSFNKGEDLSKHWAFASGRWKGESRNNHFTEIEIRGLTADIRSLLQRPGQRGLTDFFESTQQLSGLDELSWQLGVICPVAYADTYPVPERYLTRARDALLYERGRDLLKADFTLYLNGTPIRRRIVLPHYRQTKLSARSGAFLEKRGWGFDIVYFRSRRGSPTRFEGYLVVQGAELFPVELQGLLVRLRGVAVGWHRTLDLSGAVMSTMAPCFSGEVWVEGLDDALQFDRESFREDHPRFRELGKELSSVLKEEAGRFRERSRKRSEAVQKAGPKPAAPVPAPQKPAVPAARLSPVQSYISPELFSRQPDYITRLVPQINGCWERDYYEACAIVIRRLISLLVIQLYHSRGWSKDLKEAKTGEYVGLRAMINKLGGDSRFGIGRRCTDGLKQLKELGDIAAHDHTVTIRRSDLEGVRDSLRFTCERLLFKIGDLGP